MDLNLLRRLPKVELHLHLEGAIPLPHLLRLVRESGSDEVRDLPDLAERFRYRDFDHFIALWGWKNRFIRREADFAGIAGAVVADLAARGVRYAELFVSPGDFDRQRLSLSGILSATLDGLAAGRDRHGVRTALIVDLVRDHGPERGKACLDAATPFLGRGVIGVGLGGSEAAFPAARSRELFAEAAARGFRRVAHAGEADGPASVRSALDDLGAERIGHGVRAVEDPGLVAELAARRVPLEVCPVSNLRTGVVRSLAAHPLRPLFDAGCLVTLNTDDPAMFGTTLDGEYTAAARELGFAPAELRAVALNGVRAAFLPAAEKAALEAEFAAAWGTVAP